MVRNLVKYRDNFMFNLLVLELSQWLNSVKSSQDISHIRCLYGTEVSRTILVIIIRDLIPNDDDDDDDDDQDGP
jgi:hypothetical protein